MRAIVQKVLRSAVSVDGSVVGSIGHGYSVLLGIAVDDTAQDTEWLVNKLVKVRLFNDWNDNIEQANGEILVVSQFTLYGKLKGNKLDFHLAMKASQAKLIYQEALDRLESLLPGKIQAGTFGAMMQVDILNDGPVTIELDSRNRN